MQIIDFFHQISQFVQPNWLDYKSNDIGGKNKVLNAKIETFLSILMGKKFIFSLENETFLLMKIQASATQFFISLAVGNHFRPFLDNTIDIGAFDYQWY